MVTLKGTRVSKVDLPDVFKASELLKGGERFKKQFFFSKKEEVKMTYGSLIEVSGRLGSGKLEVISDFLMNREDRHLAIIEEFHHFFEKNLIERKRILFIQSKKDIPWIVEQLFKSGLFSILIIDVPSFSVSEGLVGFRKLQVLAKRYEGLIFFISHFPSNHEHWSFTQKIRVNRPVSQMKVSRFQKIDDWIEKGDLRDSFLFSKKIKPLKRGHL
ncbi:MAG: hypothetical protein CL678_03675 [Bdellovibrionaceae bacterium]|nr:hypothetical protein [Pseudobdellovibrionaceae bacterium]|tara:strand:+ start:5214 stop:5858 length:645 start_codon:yes stop_codon:yes gene_type:complete